MPNNDDDSEWVTQTIVMEGSNIALMLFLNDVAVAALVVVVLPVRINDIAKVLGIVVTDAAAAAAARRDRQVIVVRDPMPESCIGSLLGW